MANRLHVESGYPHIRWELPSEPPKGLWLGPVQPEEELAALGATATSVMATDSRSGVRP